MFTIMTALIMMSVVLALTLECVAETEKRDQKQSDGSQEIK
jgi:hypothetical protein